MKLTISSRTGKLKSEAKNLRRNKDIPAILYNRGKESEKVSVKGDEFLAHMRKIEKGSLPNTVFTFVLKGGKEKKAIVKEIQYNRTTYDIIHLDFEELDDKHLVNLKIPIEFTNEAECVGIKLGGVLRAVIRHMRVRCLPKDIPTKFQIDVKGLSMNQSKRLSTLDIPKGVCPLVDLNEVAVVIAKR